jgi:hypothetical protein
VALLTTGCYRPITLRIYDVDGKAKPLIIKRFISAEQVVEPAPRGEVFVTLTSTDNRTDTIIHTWNYRGQVTSTTTVPFVNRWADGKFRTLSLDGRYLFYSAQIPDPSRSEADQSNGIWRLDTVTHGRLPWYAPGRDGYRIMRQWALPSGNLAFVTSHRGKERKTTYPFVEVASSEGLLLRRTKLRANDGSAMIHGFRLSPDGRHLGGIMWQGTMQEVRVANLEDGSVQAYPLPDLTEEFDSDMALDFTPSSRLVVVARLPGVREARCYVFDAPGVPPRIVPLRRTGRESADGLELWSVCAVGEERVAVYESANHRRLHLLSVYDLADGREVARWKCGEVERMFSSPDGRYIVVDEFP